MRGATGTLAISEEDKKVSIHAPFSVFAGRESVSIHAPRAGRDLRDASKSKGHFGFNPRAPCGARPAQQLCVALLRVFQSTRPVRGATAVCSAMRIPQGVSIHAPRAGRDIAGKISLRAIMGFNPRAPCGARLPPIAVLHDTRGFNPRAPCGARPSSRRSSRTQMGFNPRAPCGARRRERSLPEHAPEFQSTRPVRGATRDVRAESSQGGFQSTRPVRGATNHIVINAVSVEFQSTRPVRGATFCPRCGKNDRLVSIHAPRAGRDPPTRNPNPSVLGFNPRAPCGARLSTQSCYFYPSGFNPRAPCGARLPAFSDSDKKRKVSIHAPRAGRDLAAVGIRVPTACFNPRAPCGARPIVRLSCCRSRCFNPRAPCGARLYIKI